MGQSDNSDIAANGYRTVQHQNRDALKSWCDLAAGLDTVRGQWKASIIVALSEGAAGMPTAACWCGPCDSLRQICW